MKDSKRANEARLFLLLPGIHIENKARSIWVVTLVPFLCSRCPSLKGECEKPMGYTAFCNPNLN
jgi:hypothetical protein